MTALRTDPLRGWRVRVAPGRGTRPMDPELAPAGAPGASGSGAGQAGPGACPFCPGAEDRLGEIVAEIPASRSPGAAVPPSGSGPWGARAVLNRFPFLAAGEGVQEVLVDTPRHGFTLATLTPAERRTALLLYRDRLRARLREAPGAEGHLFRNQGRAAGSSRRHPHGQLVVVRGSTPGRRDLEARLDALEVRLGRCALCAVDRDTREAGDPDAPPALRGCPVHAGPHFSVHVLHAPLDPCHLRIVPRAHGPSFADATDEATEALADLLGRLSEAVTRRVGHEQHNLLFHDHGLAGARTPGLHWHVEYRPRVTRSAGFEQMAGVGVCPSDPAADARALHEALARSPALPDHPPSNTR